MEFIREGTSFFSASLRYGIPNGSSIRRVESRGSPGRRIVFGSLKVFFRHGKANWDDRIRKES